VAVESILSVLAAIDHNMYVHQKQQKTLDDLVDAVREKQ